MGNYNFEDESKNFGETVRIDNINNEIRKTSNTDFEDTLQFGEPLKPKKGCGNDMPERKNNKGGNGGGIFSSGIIKLSIIGGMIVFVLIFAVVFISSMGGYNGNTAGTEPNRATENNNNISDVLEKDENSSSVYAVVKEVGKDRTLSLYNLNDKDNMNVIVDGSTDLKDENNVKISYFDLNQGDVVVVTENGDTGIASSVKIPSDVWSKDSVTGAVVDITKNKIIYNNEEYLYGGDTFFSYDGKEIFPGDIAETDTVTIKGMGEMVFSAVVESGHGYVVIENGEKVENLKIDIDGSETIQDEKTGLIEVSSGQHIVTLTGDNIDDYIVNINVTEKERINIDLSEVKEKEDEKGIIDLNVNVKGYTVLVNGEKYDGNGAILQVPYGEVKIEVSKAGYEKWTADATVSEEPVSFDVELKEIEEQKPVQQPAEEKKNEGSITIYSEPGWADIYIDGEYIGVSPVMVKLPYGKYKIKGELEGYDDVKMDITLDGPEKTATINFEE